MSNAIDYKDYNGSVEFSGEDRVFHGRVVGIRDMVTFEGVSVGELEVNSRIRRSRGHSRFEFPENSTRRPRCAPRRVTSS